MGSDNLFDYVFLVSMVNINDDRRVLFQTRVLVLSEKYQCPFFYNHNLLRNALHYRPLETRTYDKSHNNDVYSFNDIILHK